MKQTMDVRVAVLRSCLALLVAGLALFASPLLVQRLYASEDGDVTCTATCDNGSCTGNQPYCTCSCHWLWKTPRCNCASAPAEPVDQTPVS